MTEKDSNLATFEGKKFIPLIPRLKKIDDIIH